MDLNYSPEEVAFRDEVRAWLKDNLPDELRDKVVNYEELTKEDLLRWQKIRPNEAGARLTGRKSGAGQTGPSC